MNSLKSILAEAKKRDKVIVFPEAGFSDRIIKAAEFLNSKKIAKVVLLGDESALVLRYKNLKGMTIINPRTSDIGDELVKVLYQKRKSKGMTVEEAENLVSDPIVFGALLVETGFADCMVAGAETTSSKVIKTALQIVGVKNKGEIASSFILIQGKNKFLNPQILQKIRLLYFVHMMLSFMVIGGMKVLIGYILCLKKYIMTNVILI